MDFVSLHTHTTFSYQDGFGLPEEHVARVAELGMSAVAFTEHGNLSSVVKGQMAGRQHGIKVIPGLEAYEAPINMRELKSTRKWHQTILASNQTGYANLMAMVARSWADDFYQWPTVLWPNLVEHSDGLIVTSGCLDSRLACAVLGGKGREAQSMAAAERLLKRYVEVFGDRFYLETQRFPQLERACLLNPIYETWSKKFGVPLVATADVHYPHPADNQMQKILHAAGRNTGSVAAAEAGWEYDILLTYPESDDQIYNDLVATGLSSQSAVRAIDNSAWIAGSCDVELPMMDRVQYPFVEDGARSAEELLRRWLNEGWYHRGFDRMSTERQREYRARINRELAAFVAKDFVHYFLMIADVTRWAKAQGIAVGPGRGSAAGSLAMFVLQVTEINPMDHPLMMFERFVDPERMDLPDVDIDFEPARGDEVRLYVTRKYGEDKVGNIGTFTNYRAKNSVDDVARVHQVPFVTAKRVKEMMLDEGISTTLATLPAVAAIFDEFPALRYAERLEGNVKSFGVHPAGIVVGSQPLTDYVTTYEKDVGTGVKKRRMSVMSVDMKDAEQLGMLKIDALKINTMGIIKTAAEIAGLSMEEVYRTPLDAPEVLRGFREGTVGGVFQFEGTTTHNICVEVQPTVFMDLSHINALSRPGPLHGGSTSDFIKARQGIRKRERYADAIEEILADTEGEIIYQEQVIALAAKVGGFDTVAASRVRKIISKKQGQAAFAELWEQFLAGAVERGVPDAQAGAVWRKMVTSGAYSFNVAHAVSYSVLAYWCMWFRIHHPTAFFYARLLHNDDDATKTLDILKDMRSTTKIGVAPLHPGRSQSSWSIDGAALRPGFAQVKGCGASTAAKIIAWRDGGGWEPPWDPEWKTFTEVATVGPRTVQALEEWASSKDPFGVEWINDQVLAIKAFIETPEALDENMPRPDAYSVDIPYREGNWNGVVLGVVLDIQYKDLFESHRNRTGKELDPNSVKDPHLARSASLYCEDGRGKFKLNVGRFIWPHYAAEIEGLKTGRDFVLAKAGKSDFPGKTIFANRLWIIEP